MEQTDDFLKGMTTVISKANANRTYLFALLGLLAIYLALFLCISAQIPEKHALVGDEAHFVETIRGFVDDFSWNRLRSYEEMSTPGPFIAYALWGKLIGDSIFSLRLANLIVGMLAVVTTIDLFRVASGSDRFATMAGIYFAIFPYTLYLSLFVHTDMLAIACLSYGWSSVLRGQNGRASLCMAGALLCRQYLVFAVAATALEACLRWYHDRSRSHLALFFWMCASAIPLLMLMAFWGGPTPENQLQAVYLTEPTRFHPASMVVYLSIWPWFVSPFLLFSSSFNWRASINNAGLAFGLVAALIFPIHASQCSIDVGLETIGLFHRGVRSLSNSELLEQLPFVMGSSLAGWLLFDQCGRIFRSSGTSKDPFRRLLFLQWCLFLIVMPCSYLHWEKYLLPVLPALILLTRNELPLQVDTKLQDSIAL